MKTINYIASLLLILSFLSCGSSKKVTDTKTSVNTYFKEHIVSYTDTTFVTPKATASVTIPIATIVKVAASFPKKDTIQLPKIIKQKVGNATITLSIGKDTLKATSDCDSLLIAAKIRKELIKETSVVTTDTNKETKIVRGYSFFDVIKYVLVAFTLGFVAGFFINYLQKLKSKLL